MHIFHIPAGSKVRYQLDPQHSIYGYVDVINGMKHFITPTVSYYVDVTSLFLKRSDGQQDFFSLCADQFYYIQPSLPLARS